MEANMASGLMGLTLGDQDLGGKSPRMPASQVHDLRRAVVDAEAAGDAEEWAGLARGKLEELEKELEEGIMTRVRETIDAEVVAVSQAGCADMVARLSKDVLQETESTDAVMHSIQELALSEHRGLAEAGIPDGAKQPMQTLEPLGAPRACAEQNLDVAGEDVERSCTLPEAGVRDGSALQLARTVARADQGTARLPGRDIPDALTLTVRHALSSEVLVDVQARPGSKVACLHQAIAREMAGAAAALHVVFQSRVLDPWITIAEAGLMHGDSVFLVQSSLRCLTASADNTVRAWQLRDGGSRESMLVEPAGPVLTSSISPCGARLLTVAASGKGELWSVETGAQLGVLDGLAMTGEFSPDGRWIVGASEDESVRVWCAWTGRCEWVLQGHRDGIKSASFSPDGRYVATASCDGTACIWELGSGERAHPLVGHTSMVKSAAFSGDGRLVITTSVDGTARLWSAASGECLQVLEGHTTALSSASFSPAMDRILTASFDGTVKVWETESGECVLTLPSDNNVVNKAIYSPDGSTMLVVSSSEHLRLFDAGSGSLLFTFSGHEDWVRAASFSSDGMFIASASYDSTVRIWSTTTGRCLQTLEGHTRAVLAVEITN